MFIKYSILFVQVFTPLMLHTNPALNFVLTFESGNLF